MQLRSGKNTSVVLYKNTQSDPMNRDPLPIARIDYKTKYYSLVWYMFEIHMFSLALNMILAFYFVHIVYPCIEQ
jgi:hypothetical protein